MRHLRLRKTFKPIQAKHTKGKIANNITGCFRTIIAQYTPIGTMLSANAQQSTTKKPYVTLNNRLQ